MNANACLVRVILQVAVDATDELPDEQAFGNWVNAALNASGTKLPENACVTIRIVSSAESSELNSNYRDVQRPTNVLAFPVDDYPIPEGVYDEAELGDLVICYQVAVREAEEQQVSVAAHFAHLAVHGSLHLVGYDHVNNDEAVVMESLERQVLEAKGFDNPYKNDDRNLREA